ncbi:exported hypothetical protein [Frankia sp. AiPs1]
MPTGRGLGLSACAVSRCPSAAAADEPAETSTRLATGRAQDDEDVMTWPQTVSVAPGPASSCACRSLRPHCSASSSARST